jgi:hypothetical protein
VKRWCNFTLPSHRSARFSWPRHKNRTFILCLLKAGRQATSAVTLGHHGVRGLERQKSDSPEWHSYRLHKSIIIWAAVAFFTGVALSSSWLLKRERLAPWLGPLHIIYHRRSPFPIQVGMNNFPFSPLTYDLPARAFIIHMYMCAPPYAEILNNLLLLHGRVA